MEKQVIKLTESQIREIVTESVNRILKESEMDEGFFDNIKSAWNGAKQGYNYQKAMDRGTEGFKTEHDYWDAKKLSNPFGSGPENTASEQANQLLAQAQEYQAMANKLKAQANALTKQYSLQKTGVNQRANAPKPATTPRPVANTPSTGIGNGMGKQWKDKRNYKTDAQSIGLWGK